MKALEKDRTRRYETANGLAADVQRHLKNEPIAARPPSRLYQFQKLARRNRAAFAATAAVLVALLLGITGSTWQAIRATRAEREQRRSRGRSARRVQQCHWCEWKPEQQQRLPFWCRIQYVFTGVGPQTPPELRLTATRNGHMLQLTATGTTNTQWRIEFRDTVIGTNAWQPLTSTNRFYCGAWLP